jgi:hypothetical protein
MSIKLCSRCYFAVQHKRRLCDICGNRSFVAPEDIVQPIEEPAVPLQVAKALGQMYRELKDELVETGHKSVRATKQMVALFRNRELDNDYEKKRSA